MTITVSRPHNAQAVGASIVGVCFLPILDLASKSPALVPFNPDKKHTNNIRAAAVHRFGREMPTPKDARIRDFKRYAEHFIRTHFKSLLPSELLTFEEWLDGTKYKPARKQELRELLKITRITSDQMVENQSFIKDEGYDEPKMPRGINSYSDWSKAILGPIIKSVDKKTFSTQWFIKGSDPRTWPRMMDQLFRDRPVMETDFSSFEAHHQGVYSHIVHYWFMHMLRTSGLSCAKRRLISRMVLGSNTCRFRGVKVMLPQSLMSGALWTSSANGVLNLLIISYLSGRAKHANETAEWLAEHVDDFFVGRVEGDDGICLDNDVDPSLMEEMGLKLKFEKHARFTEANFCGCVCDSTDFAVVTDPVRVMRHMTWLPSKYARQSKKKAMTLMRAKALSYLVTVPNCPVVRPLCEKICAMTRSYDVTAVLSEMEPHKREAVERALAEKAWRPQPRHISEASRLIVAQRFKISVCQQLVLEELIDSTPDDAVSFKLPLANLTGRHEYDHVRNHVIADNEPLVSQWNISHLPPQITRPTLDGKYQPLRVDRGFQHKPLQGEF